MKNPLFAFFFTALAAALLGFSGLIGTMLHPGAETAETVVWAR